MQYPFIIQKNTTPGHSAISREIMTEGSGVVLFWIVNGYSLTGKAVCGYLNLEKERLVREIGLYYRREIFHKAAYTVAENNTPLFF